jgi:hypothetical protein
MRILNLTRLRLRGPNGARDGFTLAAIAQNLRKLAKLRPAFSQMKVATCSESRRRAISSFTGGSRSTSP